LTDSDHKGTKREITYHVGWKKGKIHTPNDHEANENIWNRDTLKTVNGWIRIVETVFWKKVPVITSYETHWMFSSLAAVCLIATLIFIIVLGKV
jgi:hypothetical protein